MFLWGAPTWDDTKQAWKHKIEFEPGEGSGSGSGGPATIADGADVAEGAVADAVVAAGAAGTISAKLRRVTTDIASLLTLEGAVTEAAPATDTASSGLNGRLQRIAQRLTSLIALTKTPATAITLLTARATNGTDGAQAWLGGEGLLSVYGTWGGASVQIAYSPDAGVTYIDADGGLFDTADAMRLMKFPAGNVRATIAGITTTSLSAKFQPV